MAAVSALNLTGTSTPSPSIFEVVSEQGFTHVLKPAFLHVIKTLAEHFPSGKVWPTLFRNFDEAYLLFDALVQWHYMLTRGSTISEAFYRLKRSILGGDGRIKKLRLQLSFVLSVIIPYFKAKLDKIVRDDGDGEEQRLEDGDMRRSWNQVSLLFLQKYYKYIVSTMELVNLVCLLRYTFGYSKSHNLLFLLLGLRLTYTSETRMRSVEDSRAELFNRTYWSFRNAPILALRLLGEGALFGIEIGSFFVQFLEWWYNDPKQKRATLSSLPIPPPISENDQNYVKVLPEEMDKCPLCRNRFRNATALSTSGLVFCYKCINPYIRQRGKCPVTSLTSTVHHLIRIFD